MASLKPIVFLLLSVNFFSEITTVDLESSGSTSNSSEESELELLKYDETEPEINFLRPNQTIHTSDLSVNLSSNETINLQNIQALNESTVNLEFNESFIEEEFESTKTAEEFQELSTNVNEFSERERSQTTEPSMNSSLIDEVLVNTDQNQQLNDENTTDTGSINGEEPEGPLLRFDDIDISEETDYAMNEKERESLLTVIFNELKVNRSVQQKMTPDEKFAEFFLKMGKLYNLVIKDVTPFIIEKILTANTSFECMSALSKTYEAINNNQHWVFKSKSYSSLYFMSLFENRWRK